jgi:hypothetical protein
MTKIRYRLILVILLLGTAFSGISSTCLAGNKNKDVMKECKKICKQMKAEGWQVYGKAQSLEDALVSYYQSIADSKDDVEMLIGRGVANDAKMAMSKAQHNLKSQYASMLKATVSGDVNMKIENDATDSEVKSNVDFDSTYEQNVNQRIGKLKPNLILCRQNASGKTEIQLYLIVNNK